MERSVTFETRGYVGIITLNRPHDRNAVDGDVTQGIESAIDAIEGDEGLRVGVLQANVAGQQRPVFCAGADLKAVRRGDHAALTTERGGFAGIAHRDRRKPVIVAIDGLATGGGCEIALGCDIVVATTRASFGLAEVKRNLIASGGGIYRLPRAIGRSTAMLAILTGEPISAERAYQLGLIASLVEPGQAETEALRIADQIASCAPLAVRASRQVVLAADDLDDAALRTLSRELIGELLDSDDTKEGLAAFSEKRAPNWRGR